MHGLLWRVSGRRWHFAQPLLIGREALSLNVNVHLGFTINAHYMLPGTVCRIRGR